MRRTASLVAGHGELGPERAGAVGAVEHVALAVGAGAVLLDQVGLRADAAGVLRLPAEGGRAEAAVGDELGLARANVRVAAELDDGTDAVRAAGRGGIGARVDEVKGTGARVVG